MFSRVLSWLLAVGLFPGAAMMLRAQGPVAARSTFTYQGRLLRSGVPAEGRFDVRFELFHSDAGGAPVAPAWVTPGLAVSNGVFTTTLDFGADVFGGAPSWLEISVAPAGGAEGWVTLAPRQALTPTPYAIYTLKAENVTGPVRDSQLSTNIARLDADQVFLGSVRATAFSGNGAGLSNVAATSLRVDLGRRLWRVPIPFVTVSNAGNLPDVTGFGSVGYAFRMGRYEINNNQYAGFLNAVAAEDPNGLYSTNMTVDARGGILRSGAPGEYAYEAKPGMGHYPVVWVDFYDALRFCNWLHNGQPAGRQDGTTTEDGAYAITAEGVAGNTIARRAGARYWLPDLDEWYKAAYHQPLEMGGDLGDYWLYPTQSSDVPFSEPPPGGVNSINACCDSVGGLTPVGAYTQARSFYGTFDQGGNVQEWVEDPGLGPNRRLLGGSWSYKVFYAKSTDLEFDTTDYDGEGIGFRVAGTVEP